MIEFLTLFLGLVHGVQTVDLRVSPSVASIEIRLDGKTIGRLGHPPWALRCDFGPSPGPHELVAIARGAFGQEIGEARQWINSSLPDGERTPVVIDLGESEEALELSAMQTWFSAGGEVLHVLAVEHGPAEVVVVRDPVQESCLGPMARVFLERSLGRSEYFSEGRDGWDPEILLHGEEQFLDQGRSGFRSPGAGQGSASWVPTPGQLKEARSSLQGFLTLGEGGSLRFLSPRAAPVSRTAGEMNIFNSSIVYTAERQGFLALVEQTPTLQFTPRFADAVALAGFELGSSGRRRAIVLVRDGVSKDQSELKPSQVEQYLKMQQIPVFVWSFGSEGAPVSWSREHQIGTQGAARQRKAAPVACVIGPKELEAFDQAASEVLVAVSRQRVVWLEGRHLPSAITLAGEAPVRLAGDLQQGRAKRRSQR